jgi:hypothetical protein
MPFGGLGTIRGSTGFSFVRLVTQAAESVGLLNKGSAAAPAAPAPGSGSSPAISANTLNVTRVTGLGTLIAGAGGAALLLFHVKPTTPASEVVAAYIATGAIVAAALLTVAMIICADIRARTVTTAAAAAPPAAAQHAVPAAARGNVKSIQAVAASARGTAPGPNYVATLDQAYDYVLVNAKAADVTVILPGAEAASWQQMTLTRNDNSTHTVTLQPQDAETIDGEHNLPLTTTSAVQVYSNGTVWLPLP